jgi:hypothetical protein
VQGRGFFVEKFGKPKKKVYLCSVIIKNNRVMEKIVMEMSNREYQKFLAYKKADQVVRGFKRGLKEVREAKEGKRTLKSAYQLANEL